MPISEATRQRMSEAAKRRWVTDRDKKIAEVKAGWTEAKRRAQAENPAIKATQFTPGFNPSPEFRAKLSEALSGENNPFYGKHHGEAARKKMQRPRGVIARGISPDEYEEKLKAGLRWCVDHEEFMPNELFSHRGYRHGMHRKGSVCSSCTRRRWLLKAYNVTPEWYDAKLAEQDGHCALCERTERDECKPLSVDHCHKTGPARGILCGRCNMAIERLDNSDTWEVRARAYLDRYKSCDSSTLPNGQRQG